MSSKDTRESRKVFFYDDQQVNACGCLFVNVKSKKLLLIKYFDQNKLLDDLGGKVDHCDETILDTIFREVTEESNGLIDKPLILDLMHTNKYFVCYTIQSKYYFLTVEVDDTFFPDTSLFGLREVHENINRRIEWHTISDVMRDKSLSRRILCPNMLRYLKNIINT